MKSLAREIFCGEYGWFGCRPVVSLTVPSEAFSSPVNGDPADHVPLLDLHDQGHRFVNGPLGPDDHVGELARGEEVLDPRLDLPVGDLGASLESQGSDDGSRRQAGVSLHGDGVDLDRGDRHLPGGLLCPQSGCPTQPATQPREGPALRWSRRLRWRVICVIFTLVAFTLRSWSGTWRPVRALLHRRPHPHRSRLPPQTRPGGSSPKAGPPDSFWIARLQGPGPELLIEPLLHQEFHGGVGEAQRQLLLRQAGLHVARAGCGRSARSPPS